MAYNEDSSASGHDEPWIQWFCGLKGHEMFCEVERSYIEDGFNLYGLRTCVSNFSDCLDLILDRIGPDDSDDSHLTQSACTLYGLIHARYIITAHGLDAMYNKYASKEFGTCPLVQCAGQPVLPVGLKDEMGADTVKIFCPKCQCVYHPPPVRSRSSHHGPAGAAGVDGAAFGTTFPHLFLMTFSNLVPDPLPADSAYVPRVFGFRVHMSARQRTIGGSNASLSTSSTRQQQQLESITAENNKRSSNVGRRTLEQDGQKDQATSNQKERKSSLVTNSLSNPTKDKDTNSKKTNSGKRKDIESGNGNKKSNGDGSTSSKRRR
ncbi:unnamed protein product [Pseudo-nitzschia multistriata]|uniref:Casein kinase II subunit beta n=1 Tax=Pseudo-nitzschia multistriata TaxID=183589 RepID=A0A448YXJ5_9STRA|nr:unnamed protein product [Pseudo-nitzschia multistriata]